MFFKKKNTSAENSNEALGEQMEVLLTKEGNDDGEELLEILKKTNSILTYITELDYVQDMMINVNKQTEMVEGIAATSEEMAASIDDISNYVQKSNVTTNNSIEIANNTIQLINQSFKQIEQTFIESKKIQFTMQKVNDEAKKIDDMVSIIKQVAEQTNLLALNASIEAARAGEHGRGFAVVADEIKKLAENTKEQVSFISNTVDSLTSEINNTDIALDLASKSFDEGKKQMDEAVGSLDTMKNSLNGIEDSFIEISANVQEQTASAEEMSSSVMVVNDKTQALKEETNKTGNAFNEVSILIYELRVLIIRATKHKKDLDSKTFIEICINDHLMWRWRIYNMILGCEKVDGRKLRTHHTCRLGKWLDSTEFKDSKVIRILDKMEKPHVDFHTHAKEAIRAFDGGDKEKAEKAFGLMDKATKETINYLNDLKEWV